MNTSANDFFIFYVIHKETMCSHLQLLEVEILFGTKIKHRDRNKNIAEIVQNYI